MCHLGIVHVYGLSLLYEHLEYVCTPLLTIYDELLSFRMDLCIKWVTYIYPVRVRGDPGPDHPRPVSVYDGALQHGETGFPRTNNRLLGTTRTDGVLDEWRFGKPSHHQNGGDRLYHRIS
jgi:hypothetical protein